MKKILCLVFAAMFAFSSLCLTSAAAESKDYVIDSPYKDVVWSGDGQWGAYKGNLHTHSTASDARVDFRDMILEHYRQGFEVLAMTDHGVTGKAWNEQPTLLPLYLYQYIAGNKVTPLTDEEFKGVTTGTLPVDGAPRGTGMTCIVGGNELNALTVTKCHVNGMFLPEHVGDNYLGYENDHEGAVKLAHEAGALSFINHPGDWLFSNRDHSVVSDPKNVHYFSDIILKYDSCLGMEVFNENNGVTPVDRILWDNVLMECLPYGKTVIGFSNNDAHYLDDVDSSFSVFMMEKNDSDNLKKAMQTGSFFLVTRRIAGNEILGPKADMDAKNKGLPYPEFTEVSVDGHTVTIKAKNAYNISWVADGKVIAQKDIEQSANETEYVLDLDTIEGAADFSYIRCQLLGEGGCTLTQALVIDDGSEPQTYTPDTSVKARLQHVWYRFISLRIFTIIKIIAMKLK